MIIVYAGLLGSGLASDAFLWVPFPVNAGYDSFIGRFAADTLASRYFIDFCHVRKLGHAVFAHALADSLFERNLVR